MRWSTTRSRNLRKCCATTMPCWAQSGAMRSRSPFGYLKPRSTVVSLIGPPDAAFARARGMNFFMVLVFGLLSRKIIRQAKKRGVEYSFLFVRPDGRQLAEIGELLEAERIRPVIDKVFPFEQAKEALAYLEKGRAKGKVVVQMR